MKKRVTVLGSGLVGSVIANDLSTFCDVTCIDISEKNLSRTNDSITKKQCDIRDKSKIREAIKDCDIVVGAVPGYMGFNTLKDVLTPSNLRLGKFSPCSFTRFSKSKNILIKS